MPLSEGQFDEVALQRVIELLKDNGISCCTVEEYQARVEQEKKEERFELWKKNNY